MTMQRTGDPSDAELITRICGQDHEAFEALYKRYYPKLTRFSSRVTRRFDLIEEIINDVMYVVWQKASTFNHEVRLSTWIFGIAYKKCLKALAEQRQEEHLPLDDMEDAMPGVRDSGLNHMEIEDWIAVAFGHLSADQRAVMELTYHHGLHYNEIAEIMECPENTVKTRMFHARKKIKSFMPDLVDELGSTYQGLSL